MVSKTRHRAKGVGHFGSVDPLALTAPCYGENHKSTIQKGVK
jgi:hypothetical protein